MAVEAERKATHFNEPFLEWLNGSFFHLRGRAMKRLLHLNINILDGIAFNQCVNLITKVITVFKVVFEFFSAIF
jgi:hypothetical protein